MIVTLYKSSIRSHLEKLQHQTTKLLSGLEKLTYEECLDSLGLTTLEERRLRGDMMRGMQDSERVFLSSI